MQGILLLAILSVRSSYARDIEEPIEGDQPPDTVQWWISPTGTWRIRTYALDHDIHTHSIADTCDLLELARDTTLNHYSDVLWQQHEIALNDTSDHVATSSAFRAAGLDPTGVEIAPDRFVFWKPDDVKYRSQSTPR
jgi:hypothetical protein